MTLSIVIVNFNTKDRLRHCLASIFAAQTSFPLEVWVVDNASSDGSIEMIREKFPQVKLIENKENLGYAKANNIAIRKILGLSDGSTLPLTSLQAWRGEGERPKYILLLNSDVKVSPDTFDKMISFMDNNPMVGISGCKVVRPDGTLDRASRRSFPNPANAFFRLSGLALLFPKSRLASYNLTYLPDDEIAEIDSVMGAFLLIRREVVEKIGLLDEDFFMYGEDLDWCFRAKAAGFKVMYAPLTSVVHYKGSSSRKLPQKSLYEFHRAMRVFYDKHYRSHYNPFVNLMVKLGIWIRYLLKSVENFFRVEKYVSK